MFKILVTTHFFKYYGSGSICSLHTTVVEFDTMEEAEQAVERISNNRNTQNRDNFTQEAIFLNPLED